MGNFYTNYSLRGATQSAVAAALAGRTAIVAPVVDNIVVVFDEESDSQDTDCINTLGAELSRKCNCPVLAALNHDDDLLWCNLFVGGVSVDEYNSNPAFSDDSVDSDEPSGGDATKLADAFGSKNTDAVENALRAPSDHYTFAMDRHADLASALGLPSFVVAAGYTYITEGELPDGLDDEDLIRTT